MAVDTRAQQSCAFRFCRVPAHLAKGHLYHLRYHSSLREYERLVKLCDHCQHNALDYLSTDCEPFHSRHGTLGRMENGEISESIWCIELKHAVVWQVANLFS